MKEKGDLMNPLDVMNFQTQQLKMAVSTKMFSNVMDNNEQSAKAIMEMAPDVSSMTGIGGRLDIKI